MVDRLKPPEHELIDCGTFKSWDSALGKAKELVVSDDPKAIATVSLDEYKKGKWFAMMLDQPDLGTKADKTIDQLKDACPFMYPAEQIRVFLKNVSITDLGDISMIVAVYLKAGEQL